MMMWTNLQRRELPPLLAGSLQRMHTAAISPSVERYSPSENKSDDTPRSSLHDSTVLHRVTREVALQRWNSSPTLLNTVARLNLASSGSSKDVNGVQFVRHERMDFQVEWMLPATWTVNARVAQNLINLQCAPPTLASSTKKDDQSSVHGLSLTAFAYHQKVKKADSDELMRSFLKQFDKAMGHSVVVLSGDTSLGTVQASDARVIARCKHIRLVSPGSCAEILFRPPNHPTGGAGVVAHGICRAFYGVAHRTHYIALFAVPQDEFDAVEDLATYASIGVMEMSGRMSSV